MITVTVDDEAVLTGLQRLSGRLDDMRPVMAEIGEALREASMEAFADQSSPEGAAWRPLSPVTIARRRGTAHRILQDSGVLRQSITRDVDGPRSVVVGSRVEYAATHQFGARKGAYGRTSRGAPIPWGDIPARPFLGVSEEARAEVLDAVAQWLEDGS
ncbi:phage virion morphogenesis protein [Oceanicella actignis]|uniref:phage virion morphogenesis protein n=1 Tax=Oceanicella actignis TaxID=1189325 RepID=UPI0011E63BE5|nr:phage virion morphogenesis protein [Oceanicella actignis]TYO91431.1 phage virion morphogenesis protein [Oceanicella actignis]